MSDAATPGEPAPRAGRREWTGLAVLALPTLLVSIDVFVMLLALPSLSTALRASGVQQLWITDIYSFTFDLPGCPGLQAGEEWVLGSEPRSGGVVFGGCDVSRCQWLPVA